MSASQVTTAPRRRAAAPHAPGPARESGPYQHSAVLAPSQNRLDLVGLSVATANRYPGSICALGVVVVRGGRVVAREEWACRPPTGLNRIEPRRASGLGTTVIALGTAVPLAARLGQLMELAPGGVIVVPDRDVATSICQACDATGASYPELALVSARDLLARTPLLYGLPPTSADLADLDDLDELDPSRGALAAAEAALLVAHRAGAPSFPELLRLSRISPTVLDTESW